MSFFVATVSKIWRVKCNFGKKEFLLKRPFIDEYDTSTQIQKHKQIQQHCVLSLSLLYAPENSWSTEAFKNFRCASLIAQKKMLGSNMAFEITLL